MRPLTSAARAARKADPAMADTKATTAKKTDEPKAELKAEPKPENKVNQAASAWTETLRETGQSIAESALAIQERNVHFAQSLVEQGFRQVEDQTTALHKLYTKVASQSDARREAFRDLTREAAAAYAGFLMSPARLARRAIAYVRDAGKPESTEA